MLNLVQYEYFSLLRLHLLDGLSSGNLFPPNRLEFQDQDVDGVFVLRLLFYFHLFLLVGG